MLGKKWWVGLLVLALVFGMAVIGCDNGDEPEYTGGSTGGGSTKDPISGTVTVASNVALNTINGKETMTLTADTSAVTGDVSYHYQWTKDGSNISGASSKTYDVTEADYGKTLKVKVTGLNCPGELFGEIVVQSPTVCTISVKYAGTANSAGYKRVYFERPAGGSWGSTSTSLGTTAETVKLTSWSETQFKMRIDYTLIDYKYYFRKPDTTVEVFDLTNGTKSYTLTFSYDTSAIGYYSNLFATEE